MPRHRSSARRWPPVAAALLIVTAGSAVLALQNERAPSAGTPPVTGSTVPATPILSVRRVPELVAAPVADRRLAVRLESFMAETPAPNCLSVTAGGRRVYGVGTDVGLVPASLQKLVTALVVLERLGPDERLATRVMANEVLSEDGALGDLHLVGGGDPLVMTDDYLATLDLPPLAPSRLAELADRLVGGGVRRVTGSIIGDDSRYDRDRYVDAWPEYFATDGETGPLSALAVNRGFESFPPDPEVPNYQEPDPVAAADPAAHAAGQLTALLVARGVAVDGAPRSGPAPPDADVELARLDSAPVGELVAHMLRASDNQTAELLVKELGLRFGAGPTTAGGLAVMESTLAELGLDLGAVTLADGSGLASANRQTCLVIQSVLDREGSDSPIAAGLPVAAQSGTLEERFLDSPVAGRVRAKTGTLNQVTALAGFVDTFPGSTIAFSFLVNIEPPGSVTLSEINRQEELAEILATYPEGPDLSALWPAPVLTLDEGNPVG